MYSGICVRVCVCVRERKRERNLEIKIIIENSQWEPDKEQGNFRYIRPVKIKIPQREERKEEKNRKSRTPPRTFITRANVVASGCFRRHEINSRLALRDEENLSGDEVGEGAGEVVYEPREYKPRVQCSRLSSPLLTRRLSPGNVISARTIERGGDNRESR